MTEKTAVSIRFTNELKDHIEAQRVLYRRSFVSKMDKAVAVFLFGFGVWAIAAAGVQWWTVIWFPLAITEWFDLLSAQKLRTIIAYRRNPKFREEYFLTFSPDNFHFKTASIDATLLWSHYESFVESETLFLLVYGKGMHTVIPKRAFSSPFDIDAFRALIDEKIPAAPENEGGSHPR